MEMETWNKKEKKIGRNEGKMKREEGWKERMKRKIGRKEGRKKKVTGGSNGGMSGDEYGLYQ